MNKIFIETSKENSNEAQFIQTVVNSLSKECKLVYVGGYTNLPKHKNQFIENEANSEKSVVIFDADYRSTGGGFAARKEWLENQRNILNVQFKFFLFPNNHDDGIFETLLQRIVNPKYNCLLSCFEEYEQKITDFDKRLGGNVFETPDEKAKIYSYISAFKRTEDEKESFKNKHNWDFTNTKYWDLNSTKLDPLKNFLQANL